MEPEKRKEPAEASPPRRSPLLSLRCQRERSSIPRKKSPIGRTAEAPRIKAWIGIAFMVFLVIMYTYAFASGKIMAF